MVLYALEALDDALAATRAFLTPVDRTKWAKLAFVVFFVGLSGGNTSVLQGAGGGDDAGPPPDGVVWPDLGPDVWVLVGVVALVALVVGLGFFLVSAVMEFVFVEALRTEEVSIRRYWSRRWRQGLRLFGFRLVIGVLVVGGFAVLAVPFLLELAGIDLVGGLSLGLLVVLLPVVVVLAVVAGLVNGFTTAFVVPVMLLEDCGVLAGWRRLWPTIVSDWDQYLAYAIAGFVLSVVGAIAVGVVTALLAVILLIPFGILFALSAGLFVLAEPLGIGAFVVVGVLFGLAVLAVVALVQVPVQTYLRYYALLVLGDIEPGFDLIPDQRAAVRESTSGSARR